MKLCGAGRDQDYDWLGWSHWATDDKAHLSGFKNIKKYWPEDGEVMKKQFQEFMYNQKPCYLNLSR
jgi:transketolase C-terminal domain/subunit